LKEATRKPDLPIFEIEQRLLVIFELPWSCWWSAFNLTHQISQALSPTGWQAPIA